MSWNHGQQYLEPVVRELQPVCAVLYSPLPSAWVSVCLSCHSLPTFQAACRLAEVACETRQTSWSPHGSSHMCTNKTGPSTNSKWTLIIQGRFLPGRAGNSPDMFPLFKMPMWPGHAQLCIFLSHPSIKECWKLTVLNATCRDRQNRLRPLQKKTTTEKKNSNVLGDFTQPIKNYNSDKRQIASICKWHNKEDLKCPILACMLAE